MFTPMETKQRFKVVDLKGKRLAGPFATYSEAIVWSRMMRDVGVLADVKAVGK